MMNMMAGLMQMLQNGGDPMQIVRMFVSRNPNAAPAMELIRNNPPEQLPQVFYNLCKSRGIDPQQVARSCGVTLPQGNNTQN